MHPGLEFLHVHLAALVAKQAFPKNPDRHDAADEKHAHERPAILQQAEKTAEIYEQIGDLEAKSNHAAESRAAYESALKIAPGNKRLRKKLRR